MTVAELQQCLSSLSAVIRVGGKKAADDLDYVREKLTPFREVDVRTFGNFLIRAEEYHRTGIIPIKGDKPPPKKTTPRSTTDAVPAAAAKVKDLYERATDPSLSREFIEAEVMALNGLTKAQLDEVAISVGINQKYPTKAKVLEALIWRIMDRKGSFARSNA